MHHKTCTILILSFWVFGVVGQDIKRYHHFCDRSVLEIHFDSQRGLHVILHVFSNYVSERLYSVSNKYM